MAYDFTNPSQKLYRREVGGLLKGSKMTNCDKLTLVALKVPSETIDVEGKKSGVYLPLNGYLGNKRVFIPGKEQSTASGPL